MWHPAVAAHVHPCQFLGRSCSGWLTQTGLRGALECLVHAAAKTASGPTPNSFAFNSNLIRPLNGFSAQPFSAFHSYSPSLPPPTVFYLSNYSFPFCLFLSSLSVSLSGCNNAPSLAHISLPLLLSIFATSSRSLCLPLTFTLSCASSLHLLLSARFLSFSPRPPTVVCPWSASCSTDSRFPLFFTLTPLAH